MPTIECLDERTKAILSRLEDMDDHFEEHFKELRVASETRLRAVEEDVYRLKLQHASEDGKKSVILWVGGIAFMALSSIFGAVGNIIYTWMTGPHGPLSNH